MKFALINPKEKHAQLQDFRALRDAEKSVGLSSGRVDHGMIDRTMGIVVHEAGLFMPRDRQHYFSINSRLYAGNAVIYGVDDFGSTVDMESIPEITWYDNAKEVEQAIEMGTVIQPSMAIDGNVIWVWPQPIPPFMAARMQLDEIK